MPYNRCITYNRRVPLYPRQEQVNVVDQMFEQESTRMVRDVCNRLVSKMYAINQLVAPRQGGGPVHDDDSDMTSIIFLLHFT